MHVRSLIVLLSGSVYFCIMYKTNDLYIVTGKGKRLIITHIGSEDGFVNGGLLMFLSKKQGDYHQDMNAQVFENWFSSILDKLEDNSVIVMDNASYHSRKIEQVPTAKNKKQEIIDWLKEKNIPFLDDMFKRELLNIVKGHRERYEARVIDEMAKAKNKTVLRLPPYHCELNPIELIWAQIKGHVASNNKTFKMAEVKNLMMEGIEKIDSMKWKKCIQHVTEVIEPKMNEMDRNIDIMTENLIINVGSDSSSSDTSWDSE